MDQAASWVEISTGVKLSYVSFGPTSGTPVVLLHAWGESRGSFDRLTPQLSNSVHAVAVDQRGHGDADKPRDGYSLAESADDVVAFMDAIGIDSAVLLGSSSGGYVAQQVAASSPHRVAGLVLVGSPRTLQGRPSFAEEVERLVDPVDEEWVRASLTWFPRLHPVPEWYLADRVRDGARIPAHVWRETLNGLCGATPPSSLGTITAPTLIVWGARDQLLSRKQQEELARAIPASRMIVYPGTGHLVLWEQPHEVAADLKAFLRTLR
ncbi:alpha/beta fold hydrolase [Aeromicrobium sp.]|uniref:alpha/beta fold hydrolase n=1 Tax=Aeromicrobium sp. TaxID=1871063 RepID=UPI003C68BE52